MASKSVDGVLWGDYSYGIETSKKQVAGAKGGDALDKDAFLKLLMAQLQYQDPLNPTDDKEFIAQMAQFTALEQMQNLNQSYAKSQAYDMIGRRVTGTAYTEATNTYTYVDGRVTAVKMIGGEPYLVIGDAEEDSKDYIEIALKRVEHVYDDPVRMGLMQSINNNVYNNGNLALMGSLVQAITVDAEGNPKGYVEGYVTSVKFGAYDTILVVNGMEISPRELISVGPDGGIITNANNTADIVSYYILDSDTGEYVWKSGVIEDIKISNGEAYAVINGERVLFDKIDVLSNALNMVGKDVMSSSTVSKVEQVRIKSGKVYLLLADGRELKPSEVKLV